LNEAAPRNGRRTTQLTRTDWPRLVSVTAGSQRLERAGWNGPVPLLSLLAARSNALAPHGRGKGRDMPRRRTTLTPAGGGTGSSNPFPSSGESANHRFAHGAFQCRIFQAPSRHHRNAPSAVVGSSRISKPTGGARKTTALIGFSITVCAHGLSARFSTRGALAVAE